MYLDHQLQQILLNLPGYVFWKNVDSVFLGSNHAFAKTLNLKHGLDIAGLTDHTLPCELSRSANYFIQQDKQALMGNKINTLNIHTYADGERRILLTEKNHLIDNDHRIAGTIGNSIELTHGLLFSLAKFISQFDSNIVVPSLSSYGSYLISQETYHTDLSVRESQCLFYLIRGITSKKIANYLNISQRTVETYIERIKNKFNCRTKSQLIEKAINNGYCLLIPNSLLSKQCMYAISENI